MKDYLGNKICVGDDVVYLVHFRTSSNFARGTVNRITEKCAFIDGTRKEGHKIIVLTAFNKGE